MRFAKYIILKCGHNEFAITFPAVLIHKEIAQSIQTSRDSDLSGLRAGTVVAAGFIDDSGRCFGESESLKVKSRRNIDDAVIANCCQMLAQRDPKDPS